VSLSLFERVINLGASSGEGAADHRIAGVLGHISQ
jgi:hypothetical protein